MPTKGMRAYSFMQQAVSIIAELEEAVRSGSSEKRVSPCDKSLTFSCMMSA